jgi:hypothetical protein
VDQRAVFAGTRKSARFPVTTPPIVSQALVRKRRGVHRLLRTIADDEQAGLGREGPVAADAVRGQDAAPFLAEDLFERRYQYTSEGRISTAPP